MREKNAEVVTFTISGATIKDLRERADITLEMLGVSPDTVTKEMSIRPLTKGGDGIVVLWEAEVEARPR